MPLILGFLDALFWGVGNGGGALIGGALYGWLGGRHTFLTFGIVTIVMLFVVSTIMMCRSKQYDEEINEPINQTLGEEVSDVEE
jgi:MFS family permease